MAPAVVLTLVLAQSAPAEAGDSAQLERVRKTLDAPAPAILGDAIRREGLVFRVTVHAPAPEKPLWDDWSRVPSYIRPTLTAYQYDYLSMVTPEQFRGGALYTVGVPIGPFLEWLGKKMSDSHHKTGESKARAEVRRELELFLACRADPSKPGC